MIPINMHTSMISAELFTDEFPDDTIVSTLERAGGEIVLIQLSLRGTYLIWLNQSAEWMICLA